MIFVSEFNEKLPKSLLKNSAKMIFELPDGIKQTLLWIF